MGVGADVSIAWTGAEKGIVSVIRKVILLPKLVGAAGRLIGRWRVLLSGGGWRRGGGADVRVR